MSAFVESSTHAFDRVVSPELALVDSSLADLERTRSAQLAPRPRVRPHLTWANEGGRSNMPFPVGSIMDAGAAWVAPRVRRHPRATIAAATVLAVVVVAASGLLGRIGGTDTTDGPQTAALDVADTTSTTAAPSPSSADDPTLSAGPRRFAWAPVRGADGYRIELFRGSERVFAADVRTTSMTVPRSWTYGGRRRALVPGEYVWYVWPKVSGVRRSAAVVQATLAIPTG